MLKIVNLPFLCFKKVNLPISKWGMNRLLLLFCFAILFTGLFTACNKVDDPAVINTDQVAIDSNLINNYLVRNNLKGKAKRVENILGRPDTIGVWYIIEKPGTSEPLYSLSSSVTVGYTGKLLTTGKVFSQTGDIHPSFVLGEVIRGWRIGLPKVGEGGVIRLFISSAYGYGPYAQPVVGLPANAVLDFTIEVFDVTN
ncbi:FKBP-type peptidyl-prolyl cis-trans isomerase FkpA [Mucilaginibacter terrae]|uniref:Peptidyl-prolyl cis-trans isomerase n=2 Tax=Mucilaginibacter terrae TaxID=1955052 RepID=A0ABU3GSP1_9SPHI|nr:FKBP-type peptidyl-prolyl cis-trans isomerase FkpA [Mucilaginibacter terrae]